jgi:hypothetical protein
LFEQHSDVAFGELAIKDELAIKEWCFKANGLPNERTNVLIATSVFPLVFQEKKMAYTSIHPLSGCRFS